MHSRTLRIWTHKHAMRSWTPITPYNNNKNRPVQHFDVTFAASSSSPFLSFFHSLSSCQIFYVHVFAARILQSPLLTSLYPSNPTSYAFLFLTTIVVSDLCYFPHSSFSSQKPCDCYSSLYRLPFLFSFIRPRQCGDPTWLRLQERLHKSLRGRESRALHDHYFPLSSPSPPPYLTPFFRSSILARLHSCIVCVQWD